MKECYNTYFLLKFDNSKEYIIRFEFCYKENPEDVIMHFNTFDEMYDWIKDAGYDDIRIGHTLFRKKRYISWGWDGEHINEKSFSPCSIIKEYKIYYPSMSRAMELLTVEQFKEYWKNRGAMYDTETSIRSNS